LLRRVVASGAHWLRLHASSSGSRGADGFAGAVADAHDSFALISRVRHHCRDRPAKSVFPAGDSKLTRRVVPDREPAFARLAELQSPVMASLALPTMPPSPLPLVRLTSKLACTLCVACAELGLLTEARRRVAGLNSPWGRASFADAYSTPYLRQAFHFEGEVLETGYPRNDVLLSAERFTVRARVRESLGIPDGARVVLYAPTWQDDVVFSAGARPPELALDIDAFADALGEEHFLLLRLRLPRHRPTGRLRPCLGQRRVRLSGGQ
jgi:hypothetical protein